MPIVGQEAPSFNLNINNDSTISLNDYKGKYIILNFWSKAEPVSRVANHNYSVVADRSDIVYISVCIDDSDENLAMMINNEDENQLDSQFVKSQINSARTSNSWTENGVSAWLISPHGTIISKNPTAEHISNLEIV